MKIGLVAIISIAFISCDIGVKDKDSIYEPDIKDEDAEIKNIGYMMEKQYYNVK